MSLEALISLRKMTIFFQKWPWPYKVFLQNSKMSISSWCKIYKVHFTLNYNGTWKLCIQNYIIFRKKIKHGKRPGAEISVKNNCFIHITNQHCPSEHCVYYPHTLYIYIYLKLLKCQFLQHDFFCNKTKYFRI